MKISQMFDITIKAPKQRKYYITPMSHPWKRQSFLLQQQRAHNQKIYNG